MQTKLSDAFLLNPNLSEEEQVALINKELDMLLTHFDLKADKAKSSFHFYKYSSIVLAALTTIVSSLQTQLTGFPQWMLPIVSAVATVMVAFLGASSAQRIWINSRTTAQKLQAEKFLFNLHSGIYQKITGEERLKIFAERLILLWNEGHSKWEQTVNEG